jgi:stage V sporulation protein AC
MMKERKASQEYIDIVHETLPRTRHLGTMVKAFLIGGLICCMGQGIADVLALILKSWDEIQIKTLSTVILVLIASVLTGLGLYDKIGLVGGAGSLVPITGFANSVVSPAMEHKREGIILGLCSNMFKMAGPIIVIGVCIAVFVGILVLIFPSIANFISK